MWRFYGCVEDSYSTNSNSVRKCISIGQGGWTRRPKKFVWRVHWEGKVAMVQNWSPQLPSEQDAKFAKSTMKHDKRDRSKYSSSADKKLWWQMQQPADKRINQSSNGATPLLNRDYVMRILSTCSLLMISPWGYYLINVKLSRHSRAWKHENAGMLRSS